MLSDQQLITGASILIIGYMKHCTITQYHFYIVSLLGWISFTTHQPTVTILQKYLIARPKHAALVSDLDVWPVQYGGILCGTLISNALFISRLVIPEQETTSDTYETVNESALFDLCGAEDLIVLCWIHTHPTQTCFMSSRDLHTHRGYQMMMPESIAIVCAPSKTLS
jgi:proteasome lid subunit RPN8/RPN11